MASITIDNVDDQLQDCLRAQAAEHGWSVEEEAHMILQTVFAQQSREADEPEPQSRQGTNSQQSAPEENNLALIIRNIFADIGGVKPGELELPPRGPGREPPRFE